MRKFAFLILYIFAIPQGIQIFAWVIAYIMGKNAVRFIARPTQKKFTNSKLYLPIEIMRKSALVSFMTPPYA